MQFALAISPNPALQAMRRQGEPPRVVVCPRATQQVAQIRAEIDALAASEHHSLAIITKTQKQATRLHKALVAADTVDAADAAHAGVRLLDAHSAGFSNGVVVCTAHLAKGLEFDRVVVADASFENYRTEMDRNLLYVACTRAMHRLTLYSLGEPSAFLPTTVQI